jgi:hypothetical protein
MSKRLKIAIFTFIFLLAVFSVYFFLGSAPQQKNITWGVNFSQMQAENLKLDWKKTYSAVINDLGAKNIKLLVQWDWVEGGKDAYYFNDVDWQVQQAEKNNVSLIMVIGQKTGRWPECHIPAWAASLPDKERQQELLGYLKKMVLRYKDSKAVAFWQVENEPLFSFGQCPAADVGFLKQEVALVKSLDAGGRPVIISDSGEFSLWFEAAGIGDIVGNTMYRKVWGDALNRYFEEPFPPLYYSWKAGLVKLFFNKKVECLELQAEPWVHVSFYASSLEEQKKTMDLAQFKNNIEFAKKTGLDTFYFWGTEWWYWMKEKQNQPEIWDETKKLINP